MSSLFLSVLRQSLAASWLIAVIVVLRLLLVRMPKWPRILLWGLAGLRLVLPIALQSPLSLQPRTQTLLTPLANPSFFADGAAQILNNTANSGMINVSSSMPERDFSSLQVLTLVWIVGMAVMLLYAGISLLRLRRRISVAQHATENIYVCKGLSQAFAFGLLRPKIYLPYSLNGRELAHVLAHERAHLARGDHWYKLMGFVLLALHWFNPLVWLAYVLLGRDIELACDEKVIQSMSSRQRADYSQALLNLSLHGGLSTPHPLSFGRVGVRERIRNILRYKKPVWLFSLLAVILCAAVAVCFMTNPPNSTKVTIAPHEIGQESTVEPPILSTATEDVSSAMVTEVIPDEPETKPNEPQADWFAPEDMHDLVQAELVWWDGQRFAIDSANELSTLEALLGQTDSIKGGTGCPFHSVLYLYRADGAVGMVLPAEDSCSVYISDKMYFKFGPRHSDNSAFYALFGLESNDLPKYLGQLSPNAQ